MIGGTTVICPTLYFWKVSNLIKVEQNFHWLYLDGLQVRLLFKLPQEYATNSTRTCGDRHRHETQRVEPRSDAERYQRLLLNHFPHHDQLAVALNDGDDVAVGDENAFRQSRRTRRAEDQRDLILHVNFLLHKRLDVQLLVFVFRKKFVKGNRRTTGFLAAANYDHLLNTTQLLAHRDCPLSSIQRGEHELRLRQIKSVLQLT